MHALVTGAAGFVGSTLVDALIARGDRVLGRRLLHAVLRPRVEGSQPHQRASVRSIRAGRSRSAHVRHRAAARRHRRRVPPEPRRRACGSRGQTASPTTRRTTSSRRSACSKRPQRVATPKLVYASSSSVYGNAAAYPTTEDDLPRPHSPYGVTKLAAEHLCNLYAANWGLPTVSLRYFTVYGPRQRPDMAIHRLLEAALSGATFPLYGDGSAVRDFTYVGRRRRRQPRRGRRRRASRARCSTSPAVRRSR